MLAPGNERVAGRTKLPEGSVGYVEYHFAKRLGLPMAHIQNKAGRYIEPSESSGMAPGGQREDHADNLRLFMPTRRGRSYPRRDVDRLNAWCAERDREAGAGHAPGDSA